MEQSSPAAQAIDRTARVREWIRGLTDIAVRFAGTHGEREAAERVGQWMRDLGIPDVTLTPVRAQPRPGLSIGVHSLVCAIGVWWGDGLGAVVAILAVWSFRREVRWGRLLLARGLPQPQSVNVVGRAGAHAPARRVVLSAHTDTAQAGFIFRRELADLFARVQTWSGSAPPGPLAGLEALLLSGAAVAVVGWLGAYGTLFDLARTVEIIGLTVTAALSFQWAMSPATPGANDNASAVAAMLTCAETLLKDLPDDVELWVAGVGAEEVGSNGMHALLDAHPDWPRDATYFVNFECVGGGALQIIRSEGMLRRIAYPPMLVELARRVAAGGAFGEVGVTDLLAATDGHVPADRGYSALSLISLEPNGVPRNYHRTDDTLDGVDAATVLRAADFSTAVVRAALRGEAAPIR